METPTSHLKQKNPVSKPILLILTFFLGGFGVHKFYTGRFLKGILYFFFFWTGIPTLVALVEFFIYIFTDRDKLQKKYSGDIPSTIIAIIISIFVLTLFVKVVQNFLVIRDNSYNSSAHQDCYDLTKMQERYYLFNQTYSNSIEPLKGGNYGYSPREYVVARVIHADKESYKILTYHEWGSKKYYVEGPGGTIKSMPKSEKLTEE